jgi:amino acid permease
VKKKTITLIGSIALLINNVTGGSMVVLPQTFQQAGWVLPVMALFGVAALSVTCGLMIIECMTLVPGNNRFQKRLEYTNIAHIYFPTWLYWIAQIFYQLSILAQNISMIVQSVQVMDFTLVARE